MKKNFFLRILSGVLFFLGSWGSIAWANPQLVRDFKNLDKSSKGPFGPNVLQGSLSQIGVLEGSPQGTFQFQAAYRNEWAERLANDHGFYVGNLFSTNYYQLMGEFVFGDPKSSHELNHQALLEASSRALPKTSSIVRHWILEKHYIQFFSQSALARGFRLRGISGSEFELEYAKYFFNFFLSGIENDFQFLTASLLAKGSPLTDSSSLERARVLIAAEYDEVKLISEEGSSLVRRLYALRNAIHNQLSKTIIDQIDQFFRDFPEMNSDPNLLEVRSILVSYYSVNPQKIVAVAKKLEDKSLVLAAEALTSSTDLNKFLKLSNLACEIRSKIADRSGYKTSQKTDALVALSTISQYLNKELTLVKEVRSRDLFQVALNLVYIDGFLIRDNWEYFRSEIESAPDSAALQSVLSDLTGIASDTLSQAFAPALAQWLVVEPRMSSFLDNTMKSSSLNTISILAGKMKR